MIPVTKTFFPPIEEYNAYLHRIWESGWITNRGELVIELENKLKHYLHTNNIIAITNATIALQIAINAIGKTGDIITTPFSYIATSSSIIWQKCHAVFVDIESDYLTIDVALIEEKITSNTVAILATHVFGNPCDVDALELMAARHNIVLIYDAAHCFGVRYKGESIFNFGDISICSFHGTKIFHTGEGGAIFCKNENLQTLLYDMHNFGHDGHYAYTGLGINGKMSELQAAMGLAVLPYMDTIIDARKKIHEQYDEQLKFLSNKKISIRPDTDWNYSYYPIVFDNQAMVLRLIDRMNKADIFPRRYFYPSLNTLPFISSQIMPVAESVAKRILCLPIYKELSFENIKLICEIIKKEIV